MSVGVAGCIKSNSGMLHCTEPLGRSTKLTEEEKSKNKGQDQKTRMMIELKQAGQSLSALIMCQIFS